MSYDSDEKPRIHWGVYQLTDEHGLAGPFALIRGEDRKVLAEHVAKEMFGEEGKVRETNPDHMQGWGYGKGYSIRLDGDPHEPFDKVKVGEQWVDLLHGEHPHSRQDNKTYARFPNGMIEGFNGHRLIHEITITESNYLKTSGLSGNEVRKSCVGVVKINGHEVYRVGRREAEPTLIAILAALPRIHDDWPRYRDLIEGKLPGRKVYYRDHPGVIESVYGDRVTIATEDGESFPLCAHEKESMREGEEVERRSVIVTTFNDPHIWWFRE